VSVTDDLIRRIAARDRPDEAVRELAALGAAAVEPIFEGMRSMSAGPFVLAQALFQMEDKEAIPTLIQRTTDTDSMVELSATEALGYLCSAASTAALTGLLQDENRGPVTKAVAAQSLGICGTTDTVELLAVTQAAAERDEEHDLVIACAGARARHGDHGGLPAVLERTTFKGDETIRASAVRALRYVAGPGVFQALQRALKDRQAEVRRAAVEAIYYLGNRTAMDGLFTAAANRDDETANNARVYLGLLTGVEVAEKNSERKKWWASESSQFSADSCYRNGTLVSLDQFGTLVESHPDTAAVVRDFVIYTGVWIGSDAWISANPEAARERVRTAISGVRDRFEPGALYKYGGRFELSVLLEPQ
jgi:HEAT repeat protein